MAQNTPPPSTDSFRWHQSGSRKIFPIDYSYSEFSKMLGLDYRTIKKYLLHNQMFKKALSELFLDDRDNALPIPLEAVPLLSCFYRLIFSPEFQGRLSPQQTCPLREHDGPFSSCAVPRTV